MGIVRVGPEAGDAAIAGADAPGRGIEVCQTDLVVEGELPLAQPVHGLGLTTIDERPVLLALMPTARRHSTSSREHRRPGGGVVR